MGGNQKKTVEAGGIRSFIAGGFGGVCTVVSGQPFDTIKVRMQNQSGGALYKSTADCVVKTVKNEGFFALYKGMAAPLVGVVPIFAINFLGYANGKSLCYWATGKNELSALQHGLSGSLGGLYMTVLIAPGERIKCLLQVQTTGKAKYSGPMDVIRQSYREGGIRSIMRGTAITAVRDMPASGCYFAAYDYTKQHFRKTNSELSFWHILVAGGFAGWANWAWALAPDVVKTRYQTAPEGKFSGARAVVPELLRTEGVKGFFKGFAPIALRAWPANACCMMGYELALKAMNWAVPVQAY